MKLCRDCKYAVPNRTFHNQTFWLRRVPSLNSWKYAECSHPNARNVDYAAVAGEEAVDRKPCSAMRHDYYKYHHKGDYRDDSTCGKDAHWFEPREEKVAA